jgi:signal peptidase I
MDFSAILLAAVIGSGAILALDVLYLRARRSAPAAAGSIQEPAIVGYARSCFPIILIVLIVRSFLFEPFRIPSGSMMPNLVDGDFILVNKWSYGLRLPLFNTKVLSTGEPPIARRQTSRRSCRPGIIFSWATIAMTAKTAGFRK